MKIKNVDIKEVNFKDKTAAFRTLEQFNAGAAEYKFNIYITINKPDNIVFDRGEEYEIIFDRNEDSYSWFDDRYLIMMVIESGESVILKTKEAIDISKFNYQSLKKVSLKIFSIPF